MNCEKGDVARITHSNLYPESIGWIVNVWRLMGDNLWSIHHPPLGPSGFTETICPDEWLKPIRDPGDDAVDESKAWLPPVPHKETA